MVVLFQNSKNRLVAISDGVFAVVLTIMVLAIKVPTGPLSTPAVWLLLQEIFTYLISFAVVAQYWQYHQELFDRNANLPTGIYILNNCYLSLICLIPFVTAWLKDSQTSSYSAIAFAVVIAAVDILQLSMFHRVIRANLKPLQQLSSHDREEYRSVKMMVVISGLYLLISLTVPHLILLMIAAGLAFRVITTWLLRQLKQHPFNWSRYFLLKSGLAVATDN